MDTDDLSNEAYNGILIESERFNHDLTLRFAVLSGDCNDEEEYLVKVLDLIDQLRKCDEWELELFFFGELPDNKLFQLTLNKIQKNIEKIKSIPKENRHYESY